MSFEGTKQTKNQFATEIIQPIVGNLATNIPTLQYPHPFHRNYSSCGSNYIWNNSNFNLIFVLHATYHQIVIIYCGPFNLFWFRCRQCKPFFALKSCICNQQTYQCFGIISILRSPPQKSKHIRTANKEEKHNRTIFFNKYTSALDCVHILKRR